MNQKMDRRALQLALVSYFSWGFFPIYWKLLKGFPALEILAHRMLWSFVFYLLIYFFVNKQKKISVLNESRRNWRLSTLAGALLAVNWGLYIYAVNSGQILQGSLAYFINPLLNVCVGVMFFQEKMSGWLKIALAFASIGVLIQIFFAQSFPWLALALATTFCAYGTVKKVLTTNPIRSSLMEGVFALIPALLTALYFRQVSLQPLSLLDFCLFMGSGVVTGLPLFFFSAAAQKLPYSLMGMLQFIAPTLQFLVGYLMYGEKLGSTSIASFLLIWIGVGFYLRDRLVRKKQKPISEF